MCRGLCCLLGVDPREFYCPAQKPTWLRNQVCSDEVAAAILDYSNRALSASATGHITGLGTKQGNCSFLDDPRAPNRLCRFSTCNTHASDALAMVSSCRLSRPEMAIIVPCIGAVGPSYLPILCSEKMRTGLGGDTHSIEQHTAQVTLSKTMT